MYLFATYVRENTDTNRNRTQKNVEKKTNPVSCQVGKGRERESGIDSKGQDVRVIMIFLFLEFVLGKSVSYLPKHGLHGSKHDRERRI